MVSPSLRTTGRRDAPGRCWQSTVSLSALLCEGDVIVDAGNGHVADTGRRAKRLASTGLHLIGAGVSEEGEGALLGPSIMVGRDPGVPLPDFASSLLFCDSLRARRLPAALVQAQRDVFGAHTYERIDRAGRSTPCGQGRARSSRCAASAAAASAA